MRVTVTKGGDVGKVVESAGTTLGVGTAESADLRLNDDTVSREHCEIELNERGFRVRDLRSTNGLRAAGLRVHDIAASAPLEVALGDTTITIAPLAEAETRERTSIGSFGALLGESTKMRELFAMLARVAPTDLSQAATRPALRSGPVSRAKQSRSSCASTTWIGATRSKTPKFDAAADSSAV